MIRQYYRIVIIIILISISSFVVGYYLSQTSEECSEATTNNNVSTTTRTITQTQTVTNTASKIMDCNSRNLVDFNNLNPLSSSIIEEEILSIYSIVRNNLTARYIDLGDGTCKDITGYKYKYFINPFLLPENTHYSSRTLYSSQNYSVLPENFIDYTTCDDVFAFFEDVYDSEKLFCSRPYLTFTEPEIQTDGIVKITVEKKRIEWAHEVWEYYLTKNPEGNWEIIEIIDSWFSG